MILRVLGWALLLAGALSLAADALHRGDGGVHLSALGEVWYRLSPGTLDLSRAVTERYILPELWDPVIVTLLLWPAAAVLGGAGLLLLLVSSRRR